MSTESDSRNSNHVTWKGGSTIEDETAAALAEYTLRAPDRVPHDVADELRRRLVDTIGVAVAALEEAGPRAARAYACNFPGSVSVWGSRLGASMEAAALANGVAIRCLDFNDTFFGRREVGHGSDIIGGLMSIAEARRVTDEEFLAALAVGYDVLAVLADSISLWEHGWDHVNLTAIAACCAIGRLAGLSAAELREALAITVVPHAAMLQSRVGDIAMWKGFAAADAVRQALYACLLAEAGAEGAVKPFSGRSAFFALLTDENPGRGLDLDDMATSSTYARIAASHIKRWPVGYVGQSAVDAALTLKESIQDFDRIKEVNIATFGAAVDYMGSAEKWRPTTRETADHSLPYLVFRALRDGPITAAAFAEENFSDPDVHRFLQDKVRVIENRDFTAKYPYAFPTRIEVVDASSRVLVADVTYPSGHAMNPLDEAGLRNKFIGLTSPALGEHAHSVYDRIRNLGSGADVRSIGQWLSESAR